MEGNMMLGERRGVARRGIPGKGIVAKLAMLIVAMLVLVACGNGNGDGDGDTTPDDPPATEDPADDDAADDEAAGDDDAPDDADAGDADLSVRVAMQPTASSTPHLVAVEMFAADLGLDVDLNMVSDPGDIRAGLAIGEFDAGSTGIGTAQFNAYADDLPITLVAPQHAGFLEDYFVISSTIASDAEEAATLAEDLSDYADETFTVNSPGGATAWLLADALERAGLDYDQVNIEYMGFGDMVPALAGGGVVAGILSEPTPTLAEESDSGYRPWTAGPDAVPQLFTVLHYNTDWADANNEAAVRYVQALLRASRHLDEVGWDDEEVLAIVAEHTGADTELLSRVRQNVALPDLEVDMDGVNAYQDFFMGQGELAYDEPIDVELLWDFSYRDEALSREDGS